MRDTNTVREDRAEAERRARRSARYLVGLSWHVGTFFIVNAFLGLLDLLDGRIGRAPWIAALWGFALAFHALAYAIDGREVGYRERRRLPGRDGRDGAAPLRRRSCAPPRGSRSRR